MIKSRSTREILISALNSERKKLVKRLETVKENQNVPLDELFEIRCKILDEIKNGNLNTKAVDELKKEHDEISALCDKRSRMDSIKLIDKQVSIECEIKIIDSELNDIGWRFFK